MRQLEYKVQGTPRVLAFSTSLLAYGTDSEIVVLNDDMDVVASYSTPRVLGLSWGNDTLAASFEDGSIAHITDQLARYTPHTTYINSIALDPFGTCIATASDDHTCRKTHVNNGTIETLLFEHPVTFVSWHPKLAGHLLVADNSGNLSLFNGDECLLQILVPGKGYLDVHWNPMDYKLIACTRDEWHVYQLDKSMHLPTYSGQGTGKIEWCSSHPKMFALLDQQIQVFASVYNRVPTTLKPNKGKFSSISWHPTKPILACAGVSYITLVEF